MLLNYSKKDIGYALIITAVLLPLVGFLSSFLRLFHATGMLLLPSGVYTLIPAAILLISGLILSKFDIKNIQYSPLISLPALYLLLIVFLTDWISRDESLFRGPTIRGEIITIGLLLILSCLYKCKYTFQTLLLTSIPILCYTLLAELEGKQIFADDHATFFYRLNALYERFYRIPFYNPLWNAGIDERAFFATGSLNVFFLNYPLFKIFGVEKAYNYIIVNLAYILPCLSIYFASRIMQVPKRIGVIAATIALAYALNWYQWLFTYGTLGFATSVCLIPIIYAYGIKALDSQRQFNFAEALLIILATTLMLFWSVSIVVFLPLIFLAILNFKKLILKRWIALIILLLFIINLPWAYAFWKVSNVGSFVQTAEKSTTNNFIKEQNEFPTTKRKFKHRASNIDLGKSLKSFRKLSQSTNPLIIFLCIPGILILPKTLRVIYFTTCSWLFLLSIIIYPLKPQLELDRMFLIACYLLCIPTAIVVNNLIKALENNNTLKQKLIWIIPGIVCLGYLGLTPFNAGAFARKRNGFGYTTKGEFTENINKFIQNRNKAGRILFTGCITHDLDGGHISPLSIYNNQAFIASSQVGNIWWYTDVFPANFLKDGDSGRERYLELYNVSGIFAHERKQKDYYKKHPNYKKVWESGTFQFYERLNFKDNYFIEGAGKLVSQDNYGANLILNTSKAVIKFNYFPFLQAATCKVSAYPIDSEINLINLENCPVNKVIRLESKNLIERLKDE
jgi:hypothetical protein